MNAKKPNKQISRNIYQVAAAGNSVNTHQVHGFTAQDANLLNLKIFSNSRQILLRIDRFEVMLKKILEIG